MSGHAVTDFSRGGRGDEAKELPTSVMSSTRRPLDVFSDLYHMAAAAKGATEFGVRRRLAARKGLGGLEAPGAWP